MKRIFTAGAERKTSFKRSKRHMNGVRVVLLSGESGEMAAEVLAEHDVEIRVPHHSTARIQEVHLTVIHCLCDLIDHRLLGGVHGE